MNGPCEKRKRQFSLLTSPLLHQLPPAPIPVIKHLPILWNPKPGYCVQNPGKGDAASLTVSSLIWTVWLLHPAVHLLGSVWRGGICSSGRLSRDIWQSCSFSLAQMYILNVFWFFSPLSWAGKATTLFSRHTKAIIWGMQTRAVQGMLDFDYICSRDEPSVAAMVYPFT